jgi:hypothetical protein
MRMICGIITKNTAMTLNEAKASTAPDIALNLLNTGRFLLFALPPVSWSAFIPATVCATV